MHETTWTIGEVIGYLAAALVLSTVIGLERESRAKNAGMRTHTLVGMGSAVFMLVSKYAFDDVIGVHGITLDPSRIAAQIVSGIGFIGGGIIFVRRDAVRGLTTAATVWVTAAVGAACGGGMLTLAVGATAAHFLVVLGYPSLVRLALRSRREPHFLRLTYLDGHGVLRRVLETCTHQDWAVLDLEVEREDHDQASGERVAIVALRVRGRQRVENLLSALSDLTGVLHTSLGDDESF